MSNFAKNPKNGGTPAIERKTTVNAKMKKKSNRKSRNEYNVQKSELTNCCIVQKKTNKETLYSHI